MLVFNVTFQCRPGMRDEFLDQIISEGIIAGARAEAGNRKYDYYLSVDHDCDLLLIEKYRDEEAVAEHIRQSHTAKLVALKEAYVTDMIIERYETSD